MKLVKYVLLIVFEHVFEAQKRSLRPMDASTKKPNTQELVIFAYYQSELVYLPE